MYVVFRWLTHRLVHVFSAMVALCYRLLVYLVNPNFKVERTFIYSVASANVSVADVTPPWAERHSPGSVEATCPLALRSTFWWMVTTSLQNLYGLPSSRGRHVLLQQPSFTAQRLARGLHCPCVWAKPVEEKARRRAKWIKSCFPIMLQYQRLGDITWCCYCSECSRSSEMKMWVLRYSSHQIQYVQSVGQWI